MEAAHNTRNKLRQIASGKTGVDSRVAQFAASQVMMLGIRRQTEVCAVILELDRRRGIRIWEMTYDLH